MTTFDRPVPATLHVHLENGETWEATPADLEKFGLAKRREVYATFEKALIKALEPHGYHDITDALLNPLRYLTEVAIHYPDHFTEFPEEMQRLLGEVAALEETLVEAEANGQ